MMSSSFESRLSVIAVRNSLSMPALTEFNRYDDAQKHFSRERLWALFDGDRGRLNIAHECVDRHRSERDAVRIAHAEGRLERISFEQLAQSSSRIANWLRREGVSPGDRVAIMLEPSLAFYAALFGAMKSGAVAVPLFTLFGPEGLRLRTKDCRPSLLIVPKDRLALAEVSGSARVISADELLEASANCEASFESVTSADDMALFQYTSGTTRELPEAVKHRHRSVVTVAVAALYATGVRPGDRFMCPSSPAWGHGLAHGTLGPLGLGVSVASYAGPFRPERLLQAISENRVSNLSAAATHYRMMRQCKAASDWTYELDKLTFTGEPLDSETANWAEQTFGHRVRSIYGTTEVGVILAQYPGAEDFAALPGSLGKAMPGLEVAIHRPDGSPCNAHEVGEIVLKRQGEWFPTKDRGHVDNEGFFYHDGRADDVIISAGWTISAKDVENSLMGHTAVLDAAVIGTEDELRGLVVSAFVVTRRDVTADELQEFVKQNLSAHEYPRVIRFVDAIPKTPAGKTNRRAVREAFAATASGKE